MPSIVETLGDKVIDRSGEMVSVNMLTEPDKVVGLYFSSSWCPDRAFTPFLASFFSHFRTTDRGQHFEIVYVSADKDKDAFDQYFSEMPWHAVPYDDLQTRSKLWKRFKVRVTPLLVLLDGPTGKLITTNGRDALSQDLQGKDFPWAPKSLPDILNGEVLKGSEKYDCNSALDGKVKGFYFSAHWCPPCRVFTPQLMVTYEKLKADGKNFEIVFISSDRSESSFTEYYGSMPGWFALPYKDERCVQLTRLFGIEGIPTLVLVDEENKIISQNARFVVANDIEGKDYPWRQKPVDELTEANCVALNEAAAVIYFTDGDVELIEKGKALLSEIADTYIAKWTESIDTVDEFPEIRFYFEGIESEEIADTLRSFAQLDSRKPLVAILDPMEQKVYTLPESVTDITRSDIEELIDEFKQAAKDFNPLLLPTDDNDFESPLPDNNDFETVLQQLP